MEQRVHLQKLYYFLWLLPSLQHLNLCKNCSDSQVMNKLIPIDTNLRIQSDNGIPALINNPDGEISKKFISIAKNLKKSLD